MYVCGPNLYAPCHVGHAMSYIIFDVLRRYLKYRGLKVRHVQNFTDIEDNIINRARAEGLTIDEMAEEHIQKFFQDMAPLNIQKAHVYPRATHEIPASIEMVQRLIQSGDVYFRVRSKADYGKLAARDLDSMLAGARIEPGESKEYPGDFVLWKESKPGEPSWESPWGMGPPPPPPPTPPAGGGRAPPPRPAGRPHRPAPAPGGEGEPAADPTPFKQRF